MITCQKYTSDFFASVSYICGSKTKLVSSWFFNSTRQFLILVKAFQKSNAPACVTARRSATQENEMSGYGTVFYLAKTTKQRRTAGWIKFQ